MNIRLRQVFIAGILFFSAILMQGCSFLAWVGLVCTDVATCSDVTFKSFEYSWVAPPEERQGVTLTHLAVAPFAGDILMGEWWAAVLAQATDRLVMSPAEVSRRLHPNMLTHLIQNTTDQDNIALAPQLSRDIQVDGVLFGRVVSEPPQNAFWGLKERYPKRLFLHLVGVEGTLLWKGELPFTVVKGTKDIDEDVVKRTLLTHIRTHAKELMWTELGLVVMHTEP